jgi:hypothetical protein
VQPQIRPVVVYPWAEVRGMSLDCIITIAGTGKKQHNNGYRKAKTGPISGFIVDLDGVYKAVFKHVAGCAKCDAGEALQAYLDNRTEKGKKSDHGGATSNGLIKLALKYEIAKPHQVPASLVNEFLLRSGDPCPVLEHQRRLQNQDMMRYARHFVAMNKRYNDHQASSQFGVMRTAKFQLDCVKNKQLLVSPLGFLLQSVAVIHDSGAMLPADPQELMDLAEVAMVMIS